MEPTAESLAGSTLSRIAKRYVLAVRPMFLTASVLPVLLGTVWGWQVAGRLDSLGFLLAAAAVIFVHAGVNVLNDVYDDLSGADVGNTDRVYPYTGGSRFIQNDILDRARMQRWGEVLIGISIVMGALLVVMKGPEILVFGLAGIALGTLYSVPPVQLASRGLGEIAVALGFGVLPVTGAAWVQTGQFELASVLLAIPVSLWVANILVINEIPDIRSDAAAGKRTLVVRLGRRPTAVLYAVLSVGAFAGIGAMSGMGLLPWWAWTGPAVLLGIGLGVSQALWRPRTATRAMTRGIQFTLAIHTLGTVCLMAAAWLAGPS